LSQTLTKVRLKEISGAGQRRTLFAWLKANGIAYILDAKGWPIVEHDHYVAAHRVVAGKPAAPNRKALERIQQRT
jgi:hypothetical protein